MKIQSSSIFQSTEKRIILKCREEVPKIQELRSDQGQSAILAILTVAGSMMICQVARCSVPGYECAGPVLQKSRVFSYSNSNSACEPEEGVVLLMCTCVNVYTYICAGTDLYGINLEI